MLKDNEILIEGHVRKCSFAVEHNANVAVLGLQRKEMMKILTNGNGKCGMHSVFGTPSPLHRELIDPRASERIVQLLPARLPELRAQLDEGGKHYLEEYVQVNRLTSVETKIIKLASNDVGKLTS